LDIHGEWRLRVVRDVVTSAISGSWNEEAMLAYGEQFKAAAGSLGRFCSLAYFTNWGGFTAGAAVIGIENRDWAAKHGCACVAWVVEDDLMRRWVDLYTRHSTEVNPETRVFATLAQATAWLATEGFSIDPAELIWPSDPADPSA
jgi:hypothetical protein